MMELRERVRRAIATATWQYSVEYGGYEDLPEGWKDRAAKAADAAIAEVFSYLEEPTTEWIKAGNEAIDDYFDGGKDAPFEGSIRAVFIAMLRTALASK